MHFYYYLLFSSIFSIRKDDDDVDDNNMNSNNNNNYSVLSMPVGIGTNRLGHCLRAETYSMKLKRYFLC